MSSKEKPTLGGTRIKTRKRNIAAPLDPAAFADVVVQIYLDNAGDLELVAKSLESSDLNFSRYGDTFFEVVFTGGRTQPGTTKPDEGERHPYSVIDCEPKREAILPSVLYIQKILRRRPFLIKNLENVMRKFLQSLELFEENERKKLAIFTALAFSQKLSGLPPETVMQPLLKDSLVAKGLVLTFITDFFRVYLIDNNLDDLMLLLKRGKIEDNLLDFFPSAKRSAEGFSEHFTKEGLIPLVEPPLSSVSQTNAVMDHLPYLLLLSLLLFAAIASSSPLDNGGEDPLIRQVVPEAENGIDDLILNAESHFASFKRKFVKSYATEAEHSYRLGVFKANLRRAKRHQELDPTAVHGITQFSDLTPKEFKNSFLGLRKKKLDLKGAHDAPILPTSDLPENFDWRDHGAVTGVKNQGSCGSCWSFSTSGALEGANFLATGKLVSLSEQQMVDCDHECDSSEPDACDQGCNGGLMTTAFQYLLKSGGLEREQDYPYTGTDRGTCKFDKSKIAASVSNFSVVSTKEDQIAANLVNHGPLAIGINAVFMQTYIGGVSCPYICGRHLDHGVLLVGYGTAGWAPIRLKEKPYWIIKNSWGETWGEKGYYKICRGHNVCGVDSMVSTVAALHATPKE